ncbi:MAG: IS66 family transposase [Ruminococcus sp.]|nr:IS66 family transposase [Ruminococcus sp.]
MLWKEPVIHADETALRVLKRDGKQVDSQSRMWVFCSGRDSERKMLLYYYHATQSGKVVEKIIGDYSGYLQSDGYSAYNAAAKAIRVGCWGAHARRKFMDCLPKGVNDKNSKAAQALELIGRIFAADEGFRLMPEKERTKNRSELLGSLLDEYWELSSAGLLPLLSNEATLLRISFSSSESESSLIGSFKRIFFASSVSPFLISESCSVSASISTSICKFLMNCLFTAIFVPVFVINSFPESVVIIHTSEIQSIATHIRIATHVGADGTSMNINAKDWIIRYITLIETINASKNLLLSSCF